MRRYWLLFLTLAMISIFAAGAGAAPVGTSLKVKEMKGSDYISRDLNFAAFAAIEGDIMDERELDSLECDIEAVFYTARIGISLDRVDVYAILGQARDVEYDRIVGGARVKYEMEDELVWGLGLSGLIYEWEKYGIKIFGDAKYRTIADMKYENVIIEGVSYRGEQLTENKKDATWEEWQVALGVAVKLGYITPYIGLKYSEVDASAKVTLSTVSYDTGTMNAGDSIGAFVGCSITPVEYLSVDLEARFIDENAFTVALVGEF